jgi:hypothetical protein
VFDPFFIVLSHASPELSLVDDFADILEDELMRSQISLGTETEPFLFRLDNRDICILFALESLILAFSTAAAVTHALNFGSAIDTIRIFSTCQIPKKRRLCSNELEGSWRTRVCTG